jgi:hypothetical protein
VSSTARVRTRAEREAKRKRVTKTWGPEAPTVATRASVA